MSYLSEAKRLYDLTLANGDPRVNDWLLMESPVPIVTIFILYLVMVKQGPKMMEQQKSMQLSGGLVIYNFALVCLSAYMFEEVQVYMYLSIVPKDPRVTEYKDGLFSFLVTAILSGYSLRCQPVDYSDDPLAIRMASVCWWYFFSKVIELADTVFFILRKKNDQISFLHVYHHSTMLINWWLGVKYIAGGQSFFLAMINCFVHIWMYMYYGLSALGPEMQKYLWWKKYITKLQLSQFFLVILHTGYNLTQNCDFPAGFNYAVFIYAITLIILFSNFYSKAYNEKKIKQR